MMRGHHGLRPLSRLEVLAEANLGGGALRRGEQELKRRASVPVPQLCGVDAVPARDLACGEKEVDGSRDGAPVAMSRIAEGLAKMAAFGVGLQLQHPDEVCGAQGGGKASGFVLALADLGEDLPVGREGHAEPGSDRSYVWPQERVGLQLAIETRR